MVSSRELLVRCRAFCPSLNTAGNRPLLCGLRDLRQDLGPSRFRGFGCRVWDAGFWNKSRIGFGVLICQALTDLKVLDSRCKAAGFPFPRSFDQVLFSQPQASSTVGVLMIIYTILGCSML